MEAASAPVPTRPRRLYSAGGIRLVSFVTSPVVGGIMAAQNLKDAGHIPAARVAFWGSLGYVVATLFLLSCLGESPTVFWLKQTANFFGGLGQIAYCQCFIVDWEAIPPKSNFKPFAIFLAVAAAALGLLFLASSGKLR